MESRSVLDLQKSGAGVGIGCRGGNRVQKSDAGVGIGMLIGDRDYLAQK